ncbi:ThuA domain-containing protein [Paenibacillus sp. sgz500958]|uniref:ThuA domain-containing protein n=1 Tax=Paenibacillus sp. sgz500958 TaxID=3242475 RepID=UPI0036D352BE
MKLKALALGTYSEVKYHHFAGVDRELETIFNGDLELTCSEDLNRLKDDSLAENKLVISYTDFTDHLLTQEQVAGLLSYVAAGGGLLVIHNGISMQRNQELGTLLGAYFTHHPEYTALSISIKEPEHPIMQGVEDFVIDEEPYYFESQPRFQTTVLAEYPHEGEMRQAAWCHEFGLGRVVYLMPGHHLPSFSAEPFRRMIHRGGLWAAGLL